METISTEIENVIKQNKLSRLKLELLDLKKDEFPERVLELQNIINFLDPPTDNNARSKLNNIFTKIDAVHLHKIWSKLPDNYKEQKLIEYANLEYTDKIKNKEVIKILLDGLNDGKLKTAKQVIYDSKEAKITNILALVDSDEKISLK